MACLDQQFTASHIGSETSIYHKRNAINHHGDFRRSTSSQTPTLGSPNAQIGIWTRLIRMYFPVWASYPSVFPGLGGSRTLTSPGLGVRRPDLELGGLQTPRPGDCRGPPSADFRMWAPTSGLSGTSRRAPKTGGPPTRHFVRLKDIKISICQMWAPTSGNNPRLVPANSRCGRRYRRVWEKRVLVSPGLGGEGRRDFLVWAPQLWNLRFWATGAAVSSGSGRRTSDIAMFRCWGYRNRKISTTTTTAREDWSKLNLVRRGLSEFVPE